MIEVKKYTPSETKDNTDSTLCFHCGANNGPSPVEAYNKHFCCNGCKTVYQMLNQSDLCQYYDIDSAPGVIPSSPNTDRFNYLDDPSVSVKLLNYSDNDISKTTLYLPQIHCASCIWLLEKMYKLNNSIIGSRVNFVKKQIDITFNHNQIKLSQVVALLASIGYEPALSLAEGGALAKPKVSKPQRRLYLKIGVAGFAFGNIMLLSLPEYFDTVGELQAQYKSLFSFLNFALSLPVLFYAATDYFTSGFHSIRKGGLTGLNMDVPLSLGMITLFVVSFAQVVTQTGQGYFDSFAGLVFFLLLGKAFQQKTYETLSFERDYKSYFPLSATIVVNKSEQTIPLDKLAVGHRILVKNNDLIPADAVLMNGTAHIDYAFVTGEAEPVPRQIGDLVYAGGRQKGSAIELEIVKEPSRSYLTQLWNNPAFNNDNQHKLNQIANKVGGYFTYAILIIAIAAAFFWLPNVSMAVKSFTSVLIVACPCALALSVPFTFGNAMRRLGRHKLYLKKSDVIEQMASISHIVFDKTGTLTQSQQLKASYNGVQLSAAHVSAISTIAKQSNHPLSKSIVRYFEKTNTHFCPIDNFEEKIGYGIKAQTTLGEIKIGNAHWVGQPHNTAQTNVMVSVNGTFMGKFTFKQGLRNQAEQLIGKLKLKYNLSVCSGDQATDRMFLETIMGKNTEFHFNQNPEQKLKFIKKVQEKGHKVLMVGDGLNDAGALQQANCGIAVVEHTSAFSPACDAILSADAFSKIDGFLHYSRLTIKMVFVAFAISFCYNIIGLTFAVQGLLTPVLAAILMPLSSLSVVVFSVLSTNILSYRLKLFKIEKI